jgi:hypothetical protein
LFKDFDGVSHDITGRVRVYECGFIEVQLANVTILLICVKGAIRAPADLTSKFGLLFAVGIGTAGHMVTILRLQAP